MEHKTHKLKYPVMNGDVEVTEVTIGRLKGKHIMALPPELIDDVVKYTKGGNDVSKEAVGLVVVKNIVPFLAAVTELPQDVVGEMDGEDIMNLTEVVIDFFAGTPSLKDSEGSVSSES